MNGESEPATNESEAVAIHRTCSACPHCEKRVQSWLMAYVEGWHGPRAQWTREQRDWYYGMYAVLDSFARGFAFTPEPTSQISGA